jgi:hypothetical protein
LQVHFDLFSEFVDFKEEVFFVGVVVVVVSVNPLDGYSGQDVDRHDDVLLGDLTGVIPSEEVVEVHLG